MGTRGLPYFYNVKTRHKVWHQVESIGCFSGKEKMKEGLCTLISLGMSQSEHKTYQGKCMFLLYWALEMPGLALFRIRKGLLS